MASDVITYDKAELRSINRALKSMDEEGVKQAKEKSGGLVDYLKSKIVVKAGSLKNNKAPTRIAQGAKVAKSSKIGEINIGYASQKFTGGGTTQVNQGGEGGVGILGGYEFGSNKYKQFPVWSGKGDRGGSKGWFIYPTLKEEQPYLIAEWENALDSVIKEFT